MKTTNLTYLIAPIIILGSCARAYVPNVVNTPLLTKQGELQATVYTSHAGFDPQLAYAVTNNIGIMVNGSFANKEPEIITNMHKHHFLEVGAGYYTPFEDVGRFEMFGGYGFGIFKAETDLELWSTSANASTTRYFIQPAIGFSTDFADISLASRFVYLELDQDALHHKNYFAEPVITTKLGYKYVKIIFQLGTTLPFNEDMIDFRYQKFLLSAGLQINLGRFNIKE